MKSLSSDVISQPAMAAEASICACDNQRHSLLYSSGSRRRRILLNASTVVLAICLLATSSMSASLVSAFAPPSIATARTSSTRTTFAKTSRLEASGGSNKNLSNSERERRDEDRRRKERKDDVVIGKTSAKRGAKDYPIDPEATEREYLLRASKEERLVHQYTDEGMEAMKSLRLEKADQYFNKVFELRPEAYLWQAGIVKFYLGNMQGAAEIFAKSARQFEKKFGPMGMGPASEERIWRNAAELQYFYSLKKSERKGYLRDKQEGMASAIAQIESLDQDDDDDEATDVGPETRTVHRLARELFDASVHQKHTSEVVARAKLLSFAEAAATNSRRTGNASQDIKKRKLNACYFLALHYDVTGDVQESKQWIKKAFKLCNVSAGKSSDIMDTLPLLHMTARDWFDDDPYEDDEDVDFDQDGFAGSEKRTKMGPKSATTIPAGSSESSSSSSGSSVHMSDAYSDPVLEASIMQDVSKMRFEDIRDALRIRGISATGSKETLKERLFISLMDDAGYQSGFAP